MTAFMESMDERLRLKFEELAAGGFLTRENQTAAVSERFEEAVQELVEAAGMRYERHPEINGKRPDGVIHHGSNRIYLEAVCAQGPDEFRHKRGELDLCRMLSPQLIEAGLRVHLSYDTVTEARRYSERYLRATPLEDPLSKAYADRVLAQVQAMTTEPPDASGDWKGDVEVQGRALRAYVWESSDVPVQTHIGHSACAVGFIKNASKGGHVSEYHRADRERIIGKAKRYTSGTLDGYPLIVALDSDNARTPGMAAEIAYGTSHSSRPLHEDSDSGDFVPGQAYTVLMQDGLWRDGWGTHRRHLAAVWIFHSWDTARELPLLNQSQGGMCIYDTSGIRLGFLRKFFGP